MREPRSRGARERRRSARRRAACASARASGASRRATVVEVVERGAFVGGVAPRRPALERVPVQHSIEPRPHVSENRSSTDASTPRCAVGYIQRAQSDTVRSVGNLRICILGVVVAVRRCVRWRQRHRYRRSVQSARWPELPVAVAVDGVHEGRRDLARPASASTLPIEAMPKNDDKISIDPKLLNRWDGFSPTGPMLAMFPKGVSVANLPSFKDPDASLAADSPIVLLDIDTGERAPFFAEIDANFSDPRRSSALIIRPLDAAPREVALRGRDPQHGQGRRRQRRSSRPRGSSRCATAPISIIRGSPRCRPVRPRCSPRSRRPACRSPTSCSRGTSSRRPTVSAVGPHDDARRRRSPAIGTNGANLSFVATEQPPIAGLYKAYVGTFKSPNFLSDGENDDSIITRDADGAADA